MLLYIRVIFLNRFHISIATNHIEVILQIIYSVFFYEDIFKYYEAVHVKRAKKDTGEVEY